MKKNVVFSLAFLVSGVLLSGCVANLFPGGPVPSGSLVTSVRSPAQALAVAYDPTAKPTKKGVSSCGAFLGLIAAGDASIEAAMKDGNITRVHHVDHEVNTFLFGLWVGNNTVVYGE